MRLWVFTAMAAASIATPLFAEPVPPPAAPLAVNAIVPNFYYDDLGPAREWYLRALGLRPTYDDGWVVILEFGPGMQLALVDGKRGFLKPVADKGTMLSIETDDLDGWYARAARAPGTRWLKGREVTSTPPGLTEQKDITQFRLVDPGGYIVEFYRWSARPRLPDGK